MTVRREDLPGQAPTWLEGEYVTATGDTERMLGDAQGGVTG